MNEFSAKKAVCSPEFVRPGFDQAIKIACMSWCTAKREITPILFKYKGEDEMIYTVRDIRVKKMIEKPEGFQYNEYICEAPIGGFMREFRLWHIPKESRWLLVI